MITELFLLNVTAEELQAIIDWKSPFLKGAKLAQNIRYKGSPHQPFLLSHRPFVWCKNLDRCFFRFVTIHVHVFDGRTDRQTDVRLAHRNNAAAQLQTGKKSDSKPLILQSISGISWDALLPEPLTLRPAISTTKHTNRHLQNPVFSGHVILLFTT